MEPTKIWAQPGYVIAKETSKDGDIVIPGQEGNILMGSVISWGGESGKDISRKSEEERLEMVGASVICLRSSCVKTTIGGESLVVIPYSAVCAQVK